MNIFLPLICISLLLQQNNQLYLSFSIFHFYMYIVLIIAFALVMLSAITATKTRCYVPVKRQKTEQTHYKPTTTTKTCAFAIMQHTAHICAHIDLRIYNTIDIAHKQISKK